MTKIASDAVSGSSRDVAGRAHHMIATFGE
jgi:hypothetical protein